MLLLYVIFLPQQVFVTVTFSILFVWEVCYM